MATCAFGLVIGFVAIIAMMSMELGMDTELPESNDQQAHH